MEELKSTIEPGYYTLDASVKVDQEGRVVEVETTGQPNPDVGGCMRIALRGMRLPEEVLARGMLRRSAAANGQVRPERGPIGEVVTIVVVTVVFTEVIIEAFAIAVGVTVTATVAVGAAEALAKRRRKEKEPTCVDRYEACVDKGKGREMGNHWNETLCGTCLLVCNRYNQWPDHLDTGQSCIYPGFK
ncbi:hypothetical protein [Polyangium fumosum]|uniref:Uncharacterized protein n=1 Tax=Polyangium fumosum TaxID=889272 RepID=A0A4U1IXM1_9BACT|nr:hypothetical protein [Polyangium fumosum]TKC99309.1 hypothetical protein E8A74_38490 [Polyangium fumosum]